MDRSYRPKGAVWDSNEDPDLIKRDSTLEIVREDVPVGRPDESKREPFEPKARVRRE
jgi:hypothetical protein